MATKQETFDIVVAHLRSMKGRSVEPSEYPEVEYWQRCLYRNRNNSRCAIGCLIPDEIYTSKIENMGSIYSLFKDGREDPDVTKILNHLSAHDLELMGSLQGIHDNCEHWDCLGFAAVGERALFQLAQKFELQYTPREN